MDTNHATAVAGSWKSLRVFISSTFRDMQAERDYLVRFVFPELRERCARRRLHLVDVDLRWGVTEAEAERGGVLATCLDEIERCRPFFVGLLGERYGWAPDTYDVPDDARYDWLRRFERGHSITALEIYQGVLRNPGMVSRSLFYFRDPAFLDAVPEPQRATFLAESEEARGKLARLKEDIRRRCAVFENYPAAYGGLTEDGRVVVMGLDAFGRRLLEDLWSAIEQEHPQEEQPPDDLAVERTYQDAFVEDRGRRFVGRRDLLEQMARYAASATTTPLVVTGAPGCGKSALIARFATQHGQAHADVFVLPHFIGASPGSTDIRYTLRRISRELARRAVDPRAVPEEYSELRQRFVELLGSAGSEGPVLLLIDGLNQLDESYGAHTLNWLPETLPAGVRLIVSTLEGDDLGALRRRAMPATALVVGPLADEDRQRIVRETLWDYRKRLDERPGHDQMGGLLRKRESNNPLYLVVACEELRVFGEFERVSNRIERFPEDVAGLVDQVLERVEHDHGRELVAETLSLLACAREGLAEAELLDLLRRPGEARLPPAIWARLYRSLRFYLRPPGQHGEATLGFFHRELAKTTRRRYLASEEAETRCHARLAEYFDQKGDPRGDGTWSGQYPRAFGEVAYHLLRSRDLGRQVQLVRSAFLERKSEIFGDVEALLDARQIASSLAEAGNDYWDHLVHCAYAHCALMERIQALPQTIETLIRRGDIARVMAAIDAEADEYRRGLLELAVAELLAESGDAVQAAGLRRKAAACVGPHLHAEEQRDVRRHSLGLVRLGRAMMARGASVRGTQVAAEGEQTVQVALIEAGPALAGAGPRLSTACPVAPRRYVSLGDAAAAYMADYSRLAGWLVGWLIVVFLVGGAFYIVFGGRGQPVLAPLVARLSPGVRVPAALGLVLLLGVSPALLFAVVRWRRRRLPQRVERNLLGLERGVQQTAPAQQLRILLRAIRYYALAEPCGTVEPYVIVLERLIASAFARQPDTVGIVRIIREATAASDKVTDAVVVGLRQLAPKELERVLVEAAGQKARLGSTWQYLRMLAATADRVPLPDLLYRFVDDNDAPSGEHGQPGQESCVTALLAGVPRTDLARAVLAGLGVRQGTSRAGEFARAARTMMARVFWRTSYALHLPIARAEWLLWAGLYLPSYVGVPPGWLLAAVVVVGLAALQILAARTHDVYGLATVVRATEVWPHRARIDDVIRRTGSWLVEAGSIRPGLVAEAIIARTVLSRERLERAALTGYKPAEIRRSLRHLVRVGLLERRGDVVRATMGERPLLDAAASIRRARRRNRPARAISASDHETQLRRVLPIASRWGSIGLLVVVGVAGCLIGFGGVPRTLPPESWLGRLPPTQVAILVVAGCLTLYQHVRPPAKWLLGERAFEAHILKALPALLFLLLAMPAMLRKYAGAQLRDLEITGIELFPFLLINLLAPELIARWRGAGLLFPTSLQLWSQRLVSIVLFIAACLGLAYATGVVVNRN